MSKTVELLLKRRDAEPSEFVRKKGAGFHRWEILLIENGLELDDPRTYPSGKRDEKLYELVMERILTQIDLAPPMLTINAIVKQSLARLEQELSLVYQHNKEHP